jgi:hypothetical protein
MHAVPLQSMFKLYVQFLGDAGLLYLFFSYAVVMFPTRIAGSCFFVEACRNFMFSFRR